MCSHDDRVIDPHSAEEICISCGVICASGMYFEEVNAHNNEFIHRPREHTSVVNIDETRELVSRMHLPQYIIDTVLNRVTNYEKKENVNKLFQKNELIAYALYKTLKEMEIPRTLKELESCSGIPSKTLWKIESYFCEKTTSLKPIDLIASHYILVDLNFDDFKQLQKMCKDIGFVNYNPATTASFITHLYLKQKGSTTSLKKICSVFGSNYRSVNQLRGYIKKNNPNFISEKYIQNIN